MMQSAVRLPRSLHDRLREAAGERGMGEEIRRRLEASFDAEAAASSDQKTRELIEGIERLALSMEEPWHANRFAVDVFKAGIIELIERISQHQAISGATGPTGPTGPTGTLQTKYGEKAKAETIGQILAGATGTFRKR
jgi:hypothetical protein